jgi:L-threonylcarbamoyladenylate synthase
MDLLHYSVEQALQTLHTGGIILYPTDTVWGIGCDATNTTAISRIYRLKQRDDSKSMIILVANKKDILNYTTHTDPVIFDQLLKTDRPTTVIYEKAKNLPNNLVNTDGSIAIRMVKELFCMALIQKLGKPIVSTSANISGQPAPKNFSAITEDILHGVDYVVDYRQDDQTPAIPSRIIKIKKDGTIEVIRE